MAPPRSRPSRRAVTPRKDLRFSRSISASGAPVEIEATSESGTSAPLGVRRRRLASPRGLAGEQPQVVEAFADADVAGDGAGDRRLDGRLHVLGREAEAGGAARPSLGRARVAGRHADGERRARDDDAVEDVLDALHAVQDPRDLAGAVLEQRLVLAEDVDVDGLRDAAGQVADVVLEQLAEVRVEGRRDRGGAPADVRDHVLDVAALPPGLQADDVVAAVRLRDEEAELRAGAARVGADVGDRHEDLLEAVEHGVRVGQRRARGRPVVEDDRALVHRREKVGAEAPVEQGAAARSARCRRARPGRRARRGRATARGARCGRRAARTRRRSRAGRRERRGPRRRTRWRARAPS